MSAWHRAGKNNNNNNYCSNEQATYLVRYMEDGRKGGILIGDIEI